MLFTRTHFSSETSEITVFRFKIRHTTVENTKWINWKTFIQYFSNHSLLLRIVGILKCTNHVFKNQNKCVINIFTYLHKLSNDTQRNVYTLYIRHCSWRYRIFFSDPGTEFYSKVLHSLRNQQNLIVFTGRYLSVVFIIYFEQPYNGFGYKVFPRFSFLN